MPPSLQLGPSQKFEIVRDNLQSSGFTLDAVVSRLHQSLPYDFTKFRPGPSDIDPQDALELLIRIFILGESIVPSTLTPFMPPLVWDTMSALGLLAPWPDSPEKMYSPVALCPVEDVFIVSDRWSTPDNQPFKLAADSVYPALTLDAQIFLSGMYRSPCDDLLDLCTGTGVAALLAAARFAKRAVAADIAERCVAFAEFNRRLNALDNVTIVQSDVYSGIAEQDFDCILAHPPYVPVLRPKWVYHDGGIDGEEITRQIIESLPRFLRPGGTFYCHTMASDRDLPLEQRIRAWLGNAQAEFDVVLVIRDRLDPAKYAIASAVKEQSLDDLETWKKLFEEWHVAKLLDVSMTLIRHADRCQPLDLRRLGSEQSTPAEIDWLLGWQRVAGLPQVHQALLHARPRAAEGLKFVVSHLIQEGELRAADCRASVQYPFHVDIEIDSWMPLLLAACNGQRTGMELYDCMRQQGHIPADTPPEKFAALLATMVSYGFVATDEFAPPAFQKAAGAK